MSKNKNNELNWNVFINDLYENSGIKGQHEQQPRHERRINEFIADLLCGYINTDKIIVKDQHGGGEGDGEHVYVVIEHNGVTYKIVSVYYSHDGVQTDDCSVTIVKPVEKTIISWENINE